MVFTAFMIFSTGISLMLIRQRVTTGNWKSGVKYSWLYTIMQIIRSFTMISTFLYITSTETSLLFNIEIIITYILAYAFFRRVPYKGDYLGILIILTGFILFIFTLPDPDLSNCQLHPFYSRRRNDYLVTRDYCPAKMRDFRLHHVLRGIVSGPVLLWNCPVPILL